MKKITLVLMLLTSITAELCAQSSSDKSFEVPSNIIINRRFFIDLGNNNKLQIDLTDISDLQVVANIDSLLQVFLADINPLKDSIADPLTTKRIDYFTDAHGRKRIRLQQYHSNAATYLVDKGELASLRTSQDTINIIGIIANPPKAEEEVSLVNPRYYHFTFLLNDMNELQSYLHGFLQGKIASIQQHVHDKWPLVLGGSHHYMATDKNISAEKPKGFTEGSTKDYLNGFITVNVQNYKAYFVPSFTIGAKIVFANHDRTYKWETGIFWEPHYLFAKDVNGKLQTYRNDFLTVTYGQGGTTDFSVQKDFSYSTVFSLGYLIRQKGDFIDKNTFRLGAGKIRFYKTTIEPSIYFNNFFKGVTPGIRISQAF